LQAAIDPAFPNTWPVSPLPRIPTNLEKITYVTVWKNCSLPVPKILFKMQWEERLVHISVTPLRRAEFTLKQFNHNIRIPHSYLLVAVRTFCPMDILKF